MTNFITIAVKPHVAQFLDSYIANDDLSIAGNKWVDAFENHLTSDYEISVRTHQSTKGIHFGSSQYVDINSSKFKKYQISVPSRLAGYFLRADRYRRVARLMDDLFTEVFIEYVGKHRESYLTKEECLKLWRDKFDVTESLYSLGNMRKQLYRKKILGLEYPNLEKCISHKLSNAHCMQVYRLVRAGFSYRTIAKHYKIGFNTVRRIYKKISNNVSQNGTQMVHQSAA